jgi:hypothetical protein
MKIETRNLDFAATVEFNAENLTPFLATALVLVQAVLTHDETSNVLLDGEAVSVRPDLTVGDVRHAVESLRNVEKNEGELFMFDALCDFLAQMQNFGPPVEERTRAESPRALRAETATNAPGNTRSSAAGMTRARADESRRTVARKNVRKIGEKKPAPPPERQPRGRRVAGEAMARSKIRRLSRRV